MPNIERPLRPRIRRAAPVAVLLVRGEHHDVQADRDQCIDFRRRFPDWGRYGLSACAASDQIEVDRVASADLERFAVLSVFRAQSLEAAGFEVVPTFRAPHMTIAFTGDLDERLGVLAALRAEVRTNPYHR